MSALSQFENDREQQAVGPDYVEDALGHDALQNLLESGARLRATRDTEAIRRSNEQFSNFLKSLCCQPKF